MPTTLLPVPHCKQSHAGTCLPACVRMVLTFLGHPTDEEAVSRLLGTREFGTPAFRLHRLKRWGFRVTYESTSLVTIQACIEAGIPCIVLLRTGDLSYWEEDTAHAVVVVGINSTALYANDPACDSAPQVIPLEDFLLAWSEMDHRCAIIRREE